jgi:hypothetical protein
MLTPFLSFRYPRYMLLLRFIGHIGERYPEEARRLKLTILRVHHAYAQIGSVVLAVLVRR